MRFQVPQFIDVEDKIFGPLTFKQFLYLIGGVGIGFVLFRLIGFLGIIVALPFVALGIALAFYKMNGKPFIFTVEAAFNYMLHNRLYLWRRDTKTAVRSPAADENDLGSLLYIPKLSQDKLRDMTWNLDIKEGAGPGAAETMRTLLAEKIKKADQEKK